MCLQGIIDLLTQSLGPAAILGYDKHAAPPAIIVSPAKLVEVCQLLYTAEKTYFDYLACITAIDNGPSLGTVELIYNLYSIPYNFALMVKVSLTRNQSGEPLPAIPSVSAIWKAALWHEREAYDLVGIYFTEHADLRRILLPEDWEGHPLRKDYKVQENYRGIKTAYGAHQQSVYGDR